MPICKFNCILTDGANPLPHSRTATITAKVLQEYKETIKNTTSDLEEHLEEIDKNLQILSSRGTDISDEDAAERLLMVEERDSTQECLSICAKVSLHIDQVRPSAVKDISDPSFAFKEPSDTTLKSIISAQLVKQCLSICAQASKQADQTRINVFEDINMADDGYQVIVATLGDLILARRVTIGARSTQLMGQMSDDSLQQLSQDHIPADVKRDLEAQAGALPNFEGRYGAGDKLSVGSLKGDGVKPN